MTADDDPYGLNRALQVVRKRKDDEKEDYRNRALLVGEKIKEIEGFFKKVTGRLSGFECETSVPEKDEGSFAVRLTVWKLVPNPSGGPPIDVRDSQYGLLAQADDQCEAIEFYFSNSSSVQQAETLRTFKVKDINELKIKEVLVDFVTRIGELVY